MPVRNTQSGRSATEHHLVNDAAICGFHMGCRLIIRRLKKKGPKKGPNYRFANGRFLFVAPKYVALQQVSGVGRRGLEPRTYGLKAFPIAPQTTE